MTKPAWHSSFRRMRGVGRRRNWMTWGEFQELLGTLGVSLTPYHVKRATATAPPPRIYGIKHYRDCHVQMAVGYAKARGLALATGKEVEA